MDFKNPCQCCLMRPSDKNLKMPYLRRGKTEIYGEMLRDCFEIDLTLLGDEECGICEVCVGRLQDASDFKLQVQRSQARLQAWQEVPCVKDEVSIVKSEESGEHAKPHIVSKIEVEFDDNEQETYFTKKKQLGKEEVLTKEATSQPCPAPPPATVQQEPRTQPYTCDTCRKQFAKKLNLMNHMKVHNKGKIYSCEVCNSEFKRFRLLVVHKHVHKGEKPFSCEICNKRFRQTSSLIVHNRIHTGDKPFSCETCNKRFTQKRCLLSHKRTHATDATKAYTCSVCNKGFSQKGNLAAHIRVHTREKPFNCEVCKKQFGQQSTLIHHMRTHAGGKLGRNYKYNCKRCNENFKSLFTLSCHERMHNGEKPYACEECNKQFTRKDHLDRHKWLHSGTKQFCCEICGKQFTERSNLNAHKVIHSGTAPERRHRQNCCRRDAQLTRTTNVRTSSLEHLINAVPAKQGVD